MIDKTFNVLFLCTGNSARSILAEALITTMSQESLKGYSAGSHPRGQVHPIAEKFALKLKYPKENLRSKSWNEFSHPNAPHMDFILRYVTAQKERHVLSGQGILQPFTGDFQIQR